MPTIAIIGGGVIGICCALQLQRRGYAVTVIERDPPGEGATWASCGFIASSEVVPLSRPGTLKKIPLYLLNRTAPLAIRPTALPRLGAWMARFVGNARQRRMAHITTHLSALTARARGDFERMLRPHNLQNLIGNAPIIEVYDSAAELAHERPHHDLRRAQGFSIDEISGAQAAEMEPALATDFAAAAVFNDWRSVVDTKRFVTALYDAFAADGGVVVRDHVLEMECDRQRDRGVVRGLRLQSGERVSADQVVLAAGAWSAALAAQLGISLPVAAILGYQTMLGDPDHSLAHGVIYAAGGFGITPYENGIGIAGTLEFAALDDRPDYRRAKVLVAKARRVIPALATRAAHDGVERFGRRPFCPDTLPIIDRASGLSNLVVATGHGQLGVTLGATTGLLVAQIIAGESPSVNLTAYRHDRF